MERALRAASPAQRADHVRQPRIRRAGEIRRQRLPGDEDQLHQRTRRCLRRSGRQCPGSGDGHRLGPRASATSSCIPGPGYGGSCFPKDVSALIRTAREARSPLTLIEQVEKVNNERKIAMAARIERAAGGSVRDKTIAVLGVTFKPNTDDMRDAPSLVIVPLLRRARRHRARLRSARTQAGRAASAGYRMVRQARLRRPRTPMSRW